MTMFSVIVISTLVAGRAMAADQAPQPVKQSVRSAWDAAKKNILESANITEGPGFDFKPVDTVRTFGQILGHVAGANYVFCSAAKGEKPPHAEDAFEKLPSRDAIVKALGESMAYCDAVIAGLDEGRLGETIEMPFGMGPASRASAILLNIGHLNEHYGNLVTYFRIKGIVPPSSR